MRVTAIPFVLIVFLTPAFAQNVKLPEVLKPDADLEIEAKRQGLEIFKLLPRGMYQGPFNAYRDEENPLGIREGGAYYSFSTRSHSYNRTPQIGLEKGYLSAGGYYGANYGFLYDLGSVALGDVTPENPVAAALLEYLPPKLHDAIRADQSKRGRFELGSYVFATRLEVVVGHTYLLRAISFGEADKLVAFNIVSKADDDSLTLTWKPLHDFPIPKLLYQSDEALQEKIREVLIDHRFSRVEFEVLDNVVTLRGWLKRRDLPLLLQVVQSAGPFGINNQVNVR